MTERDRHGEAFGTTSLRRAPVGAATQRILAAALSAVQPRPLMRRALARTPTGIRVCGQTFELDDRARVFVIAMGKAAVPMVTELLDVLGERVADGLVVTKNDRYPAWLGPLRVMQAGHPVPDARSALAAQAALAVAERATWGDLVVCLVSGGASALVCAPAFGLSLDDLQRATETLARTGADIGQLNTVRKHLDTIKGGGLAMAAAEAQTVGLILSDVVGDRIDVIGSGPTAGDSSTWSDALTVLDAFDDGTIPQTVRDIVQAGVAGVLPETPEVLRGEVRNHLIGSNATAADAAALQAKREGFAVDRLPSLEGEARDVGVALGRRLAELPSERPARCMIAGGETTVTQPGPGRGGRNQELALAAVPVLMGVRNAVLVTLATDGEDGPTDGAGAVVTGETLGRALALGLDPADHLQRHDSNTLFEALGDVVRIGPTGTNVGDLVVLLRGSPP